MDDRLRQHSFRNEFDWFENSEEPGTEIRNNFDLNKINAIPEYREGDVEEEDSPGIPRRLNLLSAIEGLGFMAYSSKQRNRNILAQSKRIRWEHLDIGDVLLICDQSMSLFKAST